MRHTPLPLLFFGLCCSISAFADDVDSPRRFINSPQELSDTKVLEFWGYESNNGSGSFSNTYKLRYYNPLDIGSWQGRLRLDTSVISTNTNNTQANNSGQFSAGNTMLTVWGQDKDYLPNLNATIGARVVLPFGNNGQWAIGPQVRWLFKPNEGVQTLISEFSPLLRYMYGFNTKNNSLEVNPNQPVLQRNLQIYPTIGVEITPSTYLRFWDENGIIFNSAGGSWFVPIDVMVTHRLSSDFLFAVGASKQLIDTYSQYNWSVYGKISYSF